MRNPARQHPPMFMRKVGRGKEVKEVLDVGDRVSIRVTPGCGGEFLKHPIAPFANKLAGWVMEAKLAPHGYMVRYYEPIVFEGRDYTYGYYAREDLELL